MSSIIFKSDSGDTVEISVCPEVGDLIVKADDCQTPLEFSLDKQTALILANTIWDLLGEEDGV